LDPLFEELVFRYVIIRLVVLATGSPTAAVVTSALCFTAAHYVGADAPRPLLSLGAVRLFGLGTVLGMLTIARDGRIGLSIAVHSGRNLAELVSLFWFIR